MSRRTHVDGDALYSFWLVLSFEVEHPSSTSLKFQVFDIAEYAAMERRANTFCPVGTIRNSMDGRPK